ncbi:MAG TPA: hypothetical protein PL140_09295 [Ferrovaceae bacterium]|nr:hypothetical protein [Ferrovaceae bacterium]
MISSWWLLSVNVTAVANPDNQDSQCPVLYVGNHAIVTYAVLSEFTKTRTLEAFPNASRVIQGGNALMQERQDAPGNLLI